MHQVKRTSGQTKKTGLVMLLGLVGTLVGTVACGTEGDPNSNADTISIDAVSQEEFALVLETTEEIQFRYGVYWLGVLPFNNIAFVSLIDDRNRVVARYADREYNPNSRELTFGTDPTKFSHYISHNGSTMTVRDFDSVLNTQNNMRLRNVHYGALEDLMAQVGNMIDEAKTMGILNTHVEDSSRLCMSTTTRSLTEDGTEGPGQRQLD